MSVTSLLQDVVRRVAALRQAIGSHARVLLHDIASRLSRLRNDSVQASRFQIFDYVRTDEHGLSGILHALLNPKGTHAQGGLFLKAFLQVVGAHGWASDETFQKIIKEMSTCMGNIDLYLEFTNGAIVIENKPYAGDQAEQICRYSEWLKVTASSRGWGDNWLMIFLSNRGPSPHSICPEMLEELRAADHYAHLTYVQLAQLLGGASREVQAPTVNNFVSDLASFIQTRINGEVDMCMNEEQEIYNAILASDETLEAAFLVQKAFDSVKKQLFHRTIDDLKVRLEAEGMHIDVAPGFRNGEAHTCFRVHFDQGQDVCLMFHFDQRWYNQFHWGISRIAENDQLDEGRMHQIEVVMLPVFGESELKRDPTWGLYWWNYANAIGIDGDFRDWRSLPTLIAMRNGRFVDSLVALACGTRDAFQGHLDLLRPPA